MLSLTVRLTVALVGILGMTAWGQKVETIYSFPADGSKGRRPIAALTLAADGKLYGTTSEGGTHDVGTAFRISTGGQLEWLGDFNLSTTGTNTRSPMIDIGDGYLYGVTFRNGGTAGNRAGSVFRLDPDGDFNGTEGLMEPIFQIPGSGNTSPMDARWVTSGEPGVLHVICYDYAGIWRVPTNGESPEVAYFFGDTKVDGFFGQSLIRANDGMLYGTTMGEYTGLDGQAVYGTIFRIAPDGTGMTTLREMRWEEGAGPEAALTQGPDGYLYGMAVEGGDGRGDGSIFRISPDGSDFEVIHHFDDLRYPRGQLLYAADGYFYGTANYGGKHAYGGVFRIRPNGSGYKLIHSFDGKNGGYSDAGLTLGPDGNLYGTTSRGGQDKEGAIFRVLVKLPPPPANHAPVALNDFAYTANEAIDIDVRANDVDPDNDPLMVSIVSQPAHGTAAVVAGGLIRYTPGDGYEGSDAFVYSINDGRGGTSSATVTIRDGGANPLVQPGFYAGVLMRDPELTFAGEVPAGQFSLQVGLSGSFTGVLMTERKRVTLRGRFNERGVAQVAVKFSKKSSATLHLAMQAGTPNGVAAVLFGETPSTGTAGKAPATAPSAQIFNISLHAPQPAPVGHGYGVMKVLSNGNITVKGTLGDGTAFSWGSNLVELTNGARVVPVFGETKTGVTGGHYTMEGEEGQEIDGTVRWVRWPAASPNKPYASGIDTTLTVFGTPFTPRAKNEPVLDLTSGTIALENGEVTIISGDFTLSGKKISVENPLRALTIKPSDGSFNGKMTVDGKTVSFKGVVHQSIGRGYGTFVINGVGFEVELTPPSLPQ